LKLSQISHARGDFIPKPGSLEFGASILHFGLRAFEAICHIGYGQDVKKFGVQLTQDEKKKKETRERKVKAEFKEKLGLIVDQRRDGGAGNTTTGNVARKALANSGRYESCPSESCPNESFPMKVAQSERCPIVKLVQV